MSRSHRLSDDGGADLASLAINQTEADTEAAGL